VAVAAGAVASGILLTQHQPQAPAPPPTVLNGAIRNGATPVDSLAFVVINADPFRLDRRPMAPPDEPVPAPTLDSTPAAPPIVLRGTFGGVTWEGLVEGLPGSHGAVVVRGGDRFEAVTIVRVARDSLFVQLGDSVVAYHVAAPWR
jgi:hypothetical protein